jgi:hypothetical protein
VWHAKLGDLVLEFDKTDPEVSLSVQGRLDLVTPPAVPKTVSNVLRGASSSPASSPIHVGRSILGSVIVPTPPAEELTKRFAMAASLV